MEQDLDFQLAYQRGVQAAIWGMPAVSIASLRHAVFRDLGARCNDVVYLSRPALARHELLTAAPGPLFVMVMLDLRDGPVVVEVPPAASGAALAGTAVDGWMEPVVDMGVNGEDAGAGGLYLFLPPGHDAAVPAGYFAAPAKTYAVHVALRIVSHLAPADAAVAAQRLRVYPLSSAARPPANRYVDAFPRAWRTLPQYDMSYFTTLAELIDREPTQERDGCMLGLLASIGIRKGTPFLPDGRLVRALELAIRDARRQMEHYFETPGLAMAPLRPGSSWVVDNSTPHPGRTYVVGGRLLVDERAGGYSYWSRFAPRRPTRGSYRLHCLHDAAGDALGGGNLYRLRVPGHVPARDSWSISVYDKESKAFVPNELDRVALSPCHGTLRAEDDGSLEVFFGPRSPRGKKGNWIPTAEGDFFLVFRLLGPEKAVFDRSFRLADVEKVS